MLAASKDVASMTRRFALRSYRSRSLAGHRCQPLWPAILTQHPIHQTLTQVGRGPSSGAPL